MPFEQVWPIINTLRFELEQEIPLDENSSSRREAGIFAELLKRLPVGRSELYGISGEIGMEFIPATERCDWESRIRKYQASVEPAEANDSFSIMRSWGFQPGDGGNAHTSIDYERVLKTGLQGICEKIDEYLPKADESQRDTLEGMKISLNALAEFAKRFAEANSMCSCVPWKPARTFAEGLQCIWLMVIGIAISEYNPASISFGRFDQYMFSLYRNDLADGISQSQLESQLTDFFRMLDNPEFIDAAMALNLGGRDKEGDNLFNDLSRMIVKVAKKLTLPSPLLAVRVDDTLQAEDIDAVCSPELLCVGQPTFYGEDACREALLRRGINSDDVAGWAVNSCMGLIMPGSEWQDMWGSVLVIPVAMELALNGGESFRGPLPFDFKTAHPGCIGSFDELFDLTCAYSSELIGFYIEETERRRAARLPNPFVSAVLNDCITRGKDRLHGGVRYRTLIVETMGLVNCSDALLAIKKLAFDSEEYSIETLIQAAMSDYKDQPELLEKIRSIPKYGNADAQADEMAAKLSSRIAQQIMRYSTDDLACAPSFHTLTGHVHRGAANEASLDGRRRGEPLAKNVGPRHGVAVAGHTSLILSASQVQQAEFFGGQALDLSFDPAIFRSIEGKRKFQALIKTYFQRGGLQIQINGISADMLRQAMQDPQEHQDIVVRIGGYSARFACLDQRTQQDFIDRFEAGL